LFGTADVLITNFALAVEYNANQTDTMPSASMVLSEVTLRLLVCSLLGGGALGMAATLIRNGPRLHISHFLINGGLGDSASFSAFFVNRGTEQLSHVDIIADSGRRSAQLSGLWQGVRG
jgi:hypothetical protein